MANIIDPILEIRPIDLSRKDFWLMVNYHVTFREWEKDEWYRETVEILGGEPERGLATLTGAPYRLKTAASSESQTTYTLERATPAVRMLGEKLNVNDDRIAILPAGQIVVFGVDTLRARITLEPVKPGGSIEHSDIVSGFF
jgi:hypothetical protein